MTINARSLPLGENTDASEYVILDYGRVARFTFAGHVLVITPSIDIPPRHVFGKLLDLRVIEHVTRAFLFSYG